jgi:hypothetical protein
MVVDSTGAGSQIECPGCGHTVTVPEASMTNIHTANPIASSAAAREEKHFAVPVHDVPTEVLIQKPNKPLEVAAKEAAPQVRIKCIKRTDCVEVGHDRFDEVVSKFLAKLHQEDIVAIQPLAYTHLDIGSRALMTDYGVMIIYKG